jgi:hypothetical protein
MYIKCTEINLNNFRTKGTSNMELVTLSNSIILNLFLIFMLIVYVADSKYWKSKAETLHDTIGGLEKEAKFWRYQHNQEATDYAEHN